MVDILAQGMDMDMAMVTAMDIVTDIAINTIMGITTTNTEAAQDMHTIMITVMTTTTRSNESQQFPLQRAPWLELPIKTTIMKRKIRFPGCLQPLRTSLCQEWEV